MFREVFEAVKRLGGAQLRVDVFSDGSCAVVRSSGLREAGLPEVEIADCPLRLQDVARSLVLQIARNGRDVPESLSEGKTIGGRFAHAEQPVIEVFRLVRSDTEAPTLRIVDLNDSDGAFPRGLVATHLCATAGTSRRDALRLLLVSVEVWPKEKLASDAALGDYELNPNNFWSWIDLGTILSESGQIDDAISHWKTAMCMWPRGGKLYASRMVARGSAPRLNSASSRVVHDFWQSVTNDSIMNWSAELAVELSESALAD